MSSNTDTHNGHIYTMGHSKATTASHESRTVEADAAFLLPRIKPHHHILDVGCGPGTITLGFVPLVPSGRVVGADYSSEVIERARGIASSKGLGGSVSFAQGNLLEKMPFDDDSFDIIYASQVFGHLQPADNAIKALKECRRMLKSNGILAIRDAAAMSWYPFTEEMDRAFTKNLWKGVGATNFGGFYMRSWLREAGFDVENEEKVEIAGGSTVYANRAKCQWWADTLTGRLAKGDKFRESWLKAGISEHECDHAIEMLNKWAASDDAFYGMLQTETLAWK